MATKLVEQARQDFADERIRDMNDAETAAYLREWVRHPHRNFAWPTDGCGKAQHARFVAAVNATGAHALTPMQYLAFILDYADALDPASVEVA